MKSNFEFLQQEWPELYKSAVRAEKSCITAPRTCAFYCRYALERTVHWLYENDSYLKKPYQETLSALIHEQTFMDNLAPDLHSKIIYIRKLGNAAVHSETKITDREALLSLLHLFRFLNWLAICYSNNPPGTLKFDKDLLPTEEVENKSSAQLQKLQEDMAQKDLQLQEQQKLLEESQAKLEALRQEIQKIKKKNWQKANQLPPTDDYNEAETRKLFIDLLLRETGWDPGAPNVCEFKVTGMPSTSGVGKVDYVLWGNDGLPLAAIEAKKTGTDPRAGQRQAELYADSLEKTYGQRPIIFYSNGFKTWIWDDCNYPPRPIQGFYTKDELQLIINRRKSKEDLVKISINKQIAGRYYQEEAIRRVAEAYNSKKREALLVMATGTGKTRVSIAIVEFLMKANWVRRVLFLADRTALVNQAKNAFNAHLPQASLVDITKDKDDTTSRIVFSTYPTMMNLIDENRHDGQKRFGVGHFDLIIIDEAHRSVYSKYKSIFDYFDALILGLTATPKADIDRNTYSLFHLEDHVPTYAYELDEAVKDGFLVPYKAYEVPIKFPQRGIKYDDLSDEEKEEYELTFRDEETGELPELIDAAEINEWLFNIDTVDKVLTCLMENGIKTEAGDKLGKTIIFAKNHNHAEFIKERWDKNFYHLKGKFLRVIDNQVQYTQSLIDDFYGKDKDPVVAVSVDMLDTGIDVPEIVNLVFVKIVRSKAKFWQMIGRGTRICEDLFGPGLHKECFYIFDFCENFQFFGKKPEGHKTSRQVSLGERIFQKRLELVRHLQESTEHPELHKSILDTLHENICGLDIDSCLIRTHKKQVMKYRKRDHWDNLSAVDIAEISEHLAHLPMKLEEDEYARRFDNFILNIQAAIIKGTAYERLKTELIDMAAGLEKKSNIPAVTEKINLLHDIQSGEFWKNINIAKLDNVREGMRDLIKFLDKEEKKIVITDFEDTMGDVIDVTGTFHYGNLKDYRKKVEKYIRENQDHITVYKLKHNKRITDFDITQLESMLFKDDIGTREEFQRAFGDKPLGYFIRSIIGLDKMAAKEAFSDFMSKGSLTGNQINFINQIIDYLTHNGVMEPDILFEPPFTEKHHQGIIGLFPTEAKNIIEIIKTINKNAEAA
ncbi:DUF4145 domain-containing protein [Candidatus Parcubacteria bacterium]|nr:MAG: DUF4145 domain-containing protein [Candidatus Parcubacteria bacterium]